MLVEAVAALGRPDVRLIVVGDGPEQAPLEALAAERGLAGRVQFRGFVPQEVKYQLLAASDIFALPSLHEAFGLVYLEAMHCGMPVLAAKPGGQEDYLEEGVTGFLLAPEDREGLTRALGRLAADPELRARIGRHNRERARDFTAGHACRLVRRPVRPDAHRAAFTPARRGLTVAAAHHVNAAGRAMPPAMEKDEADLMSAQPAETMVTRRAPPTAERPAPRRLAARLEPFDSYWQAPKDVESGYAKFAAYYRHNYLKHLPADRNARILTWPQRRRRGFRFRQGRLRQAARPRLRDQRGFPVPGAERRALRRDHPRAGAESPRRSTR